MADHEKVMLVVVPWDQRAADDFAPVILPDNPRGLEGLKSDVDAGIATVLGVYADQARIGSVLVRIERGGNGSYFVIECANADLPGFDLVETCMPALEGWARKAGCVAVDIPTHRPGLVFKLKKRGYQVAQTMMRQGLQ
ncbi:MULTISPECIES: hypothetical protein [unclassified Thalassospira]|uniref:hypothetical protein n=1 Tax=unclassified Thalassospira TaxID=2648997 RepID=UPI0025E29ECD|nr:MULTISPECIES: hypothetical protein [unclassified Thalassospira]|tara:strand:+ start:7180 stop:7596 length:417 start_codon:yes stop_codon:yes gene_type:complete